MNVKKTSKMWRILRRVFLALAMSLLFFFIGFFPGIGFHVYDIDELYFKPKYSSGYADAAFSCDILFDPLTHPFYWIHPDVVGRFVGNFSVMYVPEGYGGGEFGGPRFPLWPKQRYDYYISVFQVWGLYPNLLVLFLISLAIEALNFRIVYVAYFLGIIGFLAAQLIGIFVGVTIGAVVILYIKRSVPRDNILYNFWHSLWE